MRRARRAGVTVEVAVARTLERYFQLLARWNAKINLTGFSLAVPDDEAIDRLLVEPLVAARHLPSRPLAQIDIGSGSGSPALPMYAAGPGGSLRLVEVKTRKAVFLSEAVRHLEFPNATVETARFEQLLARPELHEAFDVLSVRAVRAETKTLMSLQAFLRPGGQVFWFRGPSGPDVPPDAIYPLSWTATFPLVESLRSRLVVITKAPPRK